MFKRFNDKSSPTRGILLISVAISTAYWFADGFLRFAVFESGDFRNVLFPSNIQDFCTRIFVVCVVLGTGVYSHILVNKFSEAKDQLRILFDNAPDAIFIADSESGIITDANPAASKLLHRSKDEIIGLHQSELYPPAKRDDSTTMFIAQFDESERGKETRPIEQAILRSDGVEVPVEVMSKKANFGQTSVLQEIFRDITERKRIEKELVVRNAAIESSITAIGVIDMTGKITYANKACVKMWGYVDKNEIVGRHISEFWEGEAVYRNLKVIAEKGAAAGEDVGKRKDGSLFDVSFAGNIVNDEKGKPTAILGSFVDITDRNRMEHVLRQSEEKYRSVVEDSPILICTFLPEGEITFVNAAYCKYFGMKKEKLIGKKFTSLLPEEERHTVIRNILSLNVDSPLMWHEHKVIAPDGQIKWQRWTNRGIFDDKGQIFCFQSFGEDITEAREAREALRESEERYRTLIESTDAAITAINSDGTFLFMNKIGAEILGGDPADFIGKTMWDALPKDIADLQMENVRQVIQTAIGINVTSLTTIQGESRWYNTVIEPLRDGNTEVVSAIVIARDIHEQRQSEERLEMYRSEIARMERLASLGTLSATAAHEITQPLTVIQLSLQNALDELKTASYPETITRNIENGLDEVLTITSIIDKFRGFARRSSYPTVSEVDLRAVAERIIDLLSGLSKRNSTILRIEGMDGLPHVHSVEKDLEQLFFALIDNAIRAGNYKQDKKVIVSGAVTDDHIELRFSDNCGGIAPKNLDRIFEPFFTTKPAGEGTGLGLCIVHDIVVRLSGRIRVESTFGEGSTFIITLPIRMKIES